jgi:anti-sigma regulatory factor (Ser/Thr protein kinase)
MSKLHTTAKLENLTEVLAFVDEYLESAECSTKTQISIDIAVEEIFVNIASYAYTPDIGDADIEIGSDDGNKSVWITFDDTGIPYNPLAKEDPDVTLTAEERAVGGLGIFMVKKSMDKMDYRYENGHNILTLTKIL